VSEPLVTAAEEVRLGFYGKLPARGDFVTRRLPPSFIGPWDSWLQNSIAATIEQLGDQWLPSYLEAPLWRFLVGAGMCGETAMAGVIMPSVDRVGRYFPLTLAAPLGECRAPTRTAVAGAEWFERLEALALSTLADDTDFDAFEKESALVAALSPAASRVGCGGVGAVLALEAEEPAGTAAYELSDAVLASAWSNWAFWWTTGSERIRPCMMATRDLPHAPRFAAFLDGQWERWGWMTP
jgi:type VI secretion system protein ImpM